LSPAFLVVKMERYSTRNGGLVRVQIPEGRFFRASSSDPDLIEMAHAWGVIRKPRTPFGSRSGNGRLSRTQGQREIPKVNDQSQSATTVSRGSPGWVDIGAKDVRGIFEPRTTKSRMFSKGRDLSG